MKYTKLYLCDDQASLMMEFTHSRLWLRPHQSSERNLRQGLEEEHCNF